MRLEKFEPADLQPIGEGGENRVFVDPNNERHVIAERKESAEKNTFRHMKGKFYLTKIVHALLPNHIPDIYQVTEASTGEQAIRQQTIDRELIDHSESHARLQEAQRLGNDVQAGEQVIKIIDEMGEGLSEVDSKMEGLGLAFCVDKNIGNYIKDESGSVHYLETLNPWQADPTSPGGIEVFFDEETLRDAIEKIPDELTRLNCEGYLNRLMTLVDEERSIPAVEIDPQINKEELAKLEAEFALFESQHSIENLMAITDANEARNSVERKSAKDALGPLLAHLNSSRNENLITAEQFLELNEKFKRFSRAVGMLNGGKVDHMR